jgi:hypothetical protein
MSRTSAPYWARPVHLVDVVAKGRADDLKRRLSVPARDALSRGRRSATHAGLWGAECVEEDVGDGPLKRLVIAELNQPNVGEAG